MSFFQTSVLNKHLQAQDQGQIKAAYSLFVETFHDTERQQNIRNSNEEQYQEGFLRELFVNVLGYTINPDPSFNLILEKKNVDDARKADGAILRNQKVLAVIELKGTDTKDLEKITEQAFGYKNHQPDCQYVITSNYEKLRFYIHNAVEHLEFSLFDLPFKQFQILWMFLQKDNLLNGLPLLVKKESLQEEENITKRLYEDYATFKQELWQNMVRKNPTIDELLLYKKSQKLLDRFLFILFAEDKGLLPPNSISMNIKQWIKLESMDEYRPLYSRFVKFFGHINNGYIGDGYEIHAYNGGLFQTDELLDGLVIDDALLQKHCLRLSGYDFETEIDTDILGHIFEHSLSDIENVRARLAGIEIDKSKSKRKRDGVFYTPKFITKHIIDITIGKLCRDKKRDLKIVEEEFADAQITRRKTITEKLNNRLKEYREWLLELTICDPACGSGAFLNQTLEFLITEHRRVDELEAQLFGSAIVFQNAERHILENNIYGVDINEESVEIARLSLWLRTAHPGRKLTTLSNNIKTGNSLIDDKEVSGELAFNWRDEFPQVFSNGGFDVVIGNPPYVNSKGENFTDEIKAYLNENYQVASYQIDLYVLFLEKGLSIQKQSGYTSFIVPNSWLNNLYLEPVRRFILSKSAIEEIVSMPPATFADASVDTVIISYRKKEEDSLVRLLDYKNAEFNETGSYHQRKWLASKNAVINLHLTDALAKLINKIQKTSVSLSSFTEIARGVGVYHKRVGHTKELIAANPYQSNRKKDDTFVPYLRGRNLSPWLVSWHNDSFISYGSWLAEPREPKYFEGDRIVLRQIPGIRLIACFVNTQFIADQSVFIAKFPHNSDYKPKAVLSVLSSKLLSFYFRYKYSEFDQLFPKLKLQHFKDLPIATGLKLQNDAFSDVAEIRLNAASTLHHTVSNFISLIQSELGVDHISKKLQHWPEIGFHDFVEELRKQKIKMGLQDKAEWLEFFENKKAEASTLSAKINRIDEQIDTIVYRLYDLTEAEVEIVERGF